MTPEASGALKYVFRSLWDLLGSFTFPGTSLTGQHLLLAPLGAIVFITVFRKMLDIGAADSSVHISFGNSGDRQRHIKNKVDSNKGQEA